MPNIDSVQLPDGSNFNIVDNTSNFATQTYVDNAVSGITKTTIGLGNVDNTADLSKPVSTAQQTAIDNAVAPKADQTLIAPVESTSTASQTYQIGDQFIYNGLLYKATAVINSGGTITPNGNCTLSDTLVEQIASGADKGSVSVTADGVKTIGTLMEELGALVDSTKLNPKSVMHAGTTQLPIAIYSGSNFKFSSSNTSATEFDTYSYEFWNNVGASYVSATKTSGTTFTNRTNVVMTAGGKIEIIY